MSTNIDMRDLELFERDILRVANQTMPRETAKFLKKNAKALVKATKSTAKRVVGKKTGNYMKGFKAGKVYKFNGNLSCRAYNNSPHAHLVEYGHVQQTKNGETFVRGAEVLKTASLLYQDEFFENTQDFIDDVLEEGLIR